MPRHHDAARRFWGRLALFLSPFALAFALLTGGLVYMGESMPLTWVAAAQRADPTLLYRPRFAPRDAPFKVISASARRASVVALGSSRILQFRAGFLTRQPEAFYNAAGPGWTLDEVETVFAAIDPSPEVLLLALDPPWFNPAYDAPVIPRAHDDFTHLFVVNGAFLHDLLNGVPFDRPGFALTDYAARRGAGCPALGLRAMRDGHAFRADGSELYGDFLVAGWLNMASARQTHHAWLRDGSQMYLPGDVPDSAALAALDRLLGRARARGVTVIGFLPSYMPSLWAQLVADARMGYMRLLPAALEAVFAAHGFRLFDFSDGALLDTSDEEFFDGWHASERSSARLFAALVEALPDVLGGYADAAALRAAADAAPNVWQVFP